MKKVRLHLRVWSRNFRILALVSLMGLGFGDRIEADSKFRVVLDPGHGGIDHGTTSGDLRESTISLGVAKKLEARLSSDSRFKVWMTRTADKTVNLFRRAQGAITNKADLFLSIHVNSSPDEKVHGTEFYIQSQMPPDEEGLFLAHRENSSGEQSEDISGRTEAQDLNLILQDLARPHATIDSHRMAEQAQRIWKAEFPEGSARIRQGPFYVLQAAVAPAVMVELGFLSHPKEAKWLTDEAVQDRQAVALFRAIEKFREIMDKKTPRGHITAHAIGRPNL